MRRFLVTAALLDLPLVSMAQTRELQERLKACEGKDAWKSIAWQANAAAAMQRATETQRPLLVVLVVGERAQKNAANV